MPFDLTSDRRQRAAIWCHEHGVAAVVAVRLISGERASGAVLRLIDEIAAAREMNRRHLVRLAQLRDVLLLRDPSTLDGPHLDPTDPRIDELCLLAEALDELVDELEAPTAA